MGFLDIFISFLVKNLFKPLVNFAFVLLCPMLHTYNFHIRVLCPIYSTYILCIIYNRLPCCDLLSHFLNDVFQGAKFCILIKSHQSFLLWGLGRWLSGQREVWGLDL